MDINAVNEEIVKKVYHLDSEKKVPLHAHAEQDEIFYCIKGEGFGVLEGSEVALSKGKEFIVPAGVKHSLRTDCEIYVASFLVPVIGD